MRVLLLGVGMQGKAALFDLARSEAVTSIMAADKDIDGLRAHVRDQAYGERVRCEPFDVTDPAALDALLADRPDLIVDLLPVAFVDRVAEAAVRHGIHLVNTCYASDGEKALADEAAAKGVTLLPECGFDPGIDLVLLGEAARQLDHVEEFLGYGGGIPEPAAVDNPLKYKLTWTFAGVLRSYRRPGRFIWDSERVLVGENELFLPEKTHSVQIEGLGELEAFPNGDVLKFTELIGWPESDLRWAGRFALRWPGHCELWQNLVDLGFLDDEPLIVDGRQVDRKRFLAALIEPRIQYAEHERDLAIIRVDLKGKKDGKDRRVVHQVIDRRDLNTGHSAMSRTVGYTASIGAQMIGSGEITKRGLLSPIHDIPYSRFVEEFSRRGIEVTVKISEEG